MSRYQYVARLIPIRKQLQVVDRNEGTVIEWFDETCFALERKHPDRVAVLLDHDVSRVAGWLDTLHVDKGWLIGTWHLDLDSNAGVVAADYTRRGTPVSVGFNDELTIERPSGIRHHVVAKLNEVSIIRNGLPAYRGAQVTHRYELPQLAKREPVEVIYTPPGATLRRPSGRVLGVR